MLDNNSKSGLYHLFQIDCVFIKNFEEIDKLNEDELKKMILILFYSFKSYDIADLLITKLDKKTKKNYTSSFRNLMEKQKIQKLY